jgi:hypothetical protein
MANYLLITIIFAFMGWVAVTDLRAGRWPSLVIFIIMGIMMLAGGVA